MKKRIGYFLLILIAIVGSKLLYGINYDLNKDLAIDSNLYKFDIIGNKDLLDAYLDKHYLYYLISDIKEKNDNNYLEYSFIKYDLSNNQKVLEYNFLSKKSLYPIKIIKEDNNYYLVSIYNNIYYKFNNKLELIEEKNSQEEKNTTYGLYNDKIFSVKENRIYYNNQIYAELPNTCGLNEEIIYNDNTYLKFYNYDKDLGCLYDMNKKNIYYLDYNNIDISSSKYLEYQNNSIKFRYNNKDYYFNDITEASNIKINNNGDYLFTYDSTNNYLRVYNLETNRIIYEKNVSFLKNKYISNINLNDYAYFVVNDNNYKYLYFWDYLKSGIVNKEMISNNEKEYKFKNDKLISEIKDKYNINVYIYDQSVKYFDNFYVIPSYDDILINTRLIALKNVLENYEIKEFDTNIKIYFEKEISNGNTYVNKNLIVIDIVNDDFKENILKSLNNILENKASIYEKLS